jgi:hypothetical protein
MRPSLVIISIVLELVDFQVSLCGKGLA